MITIEEAKKVQEILIEKFGGLKGIRDNNALESAIMRPYATFNSEELYPSPFEKAAAVIESIVVNHPFLDGNKRAGYVLMRLSLIKDGFDIRASEEEKYSFVIAIASGNMKIKEIKNWIKEHLTLKQ